MTKNSLLAIKSEAISSAKQSEKENTRVRRDIDGKIWKQRADAAPRRAETPGSISLDCTGLSRFPEVNFRKNSFHGGEISHTLRPRFQHAASAAGESRREPAAHECPQEASTHGPRSGHTHEPAVHKWTQKAPGAEPGAFHVISF